MLGHDDITSYVESIPKPDLFKSTFECSANSRRDQQRLAVVATKGEEVQAACLLEALESPRHRNRLGPTPDRRKSTFVD